MVIDRVFVQARMEHLPEIVAIYDKIHSQEEAGEVQIGWNRDIYPTEESAREAIEAGEMFIAFEDRIVAAARINQEQVHPTYDQVDWKYKADDREVMVLHTLVVDPDYTGRGIGPDFVAFYEKYAQQCGCTVLRMDTNKINQRARDMYAKLGYREAAILPCEFNGIPGVDLVCLEKLLGIKPGIYHHYKGNTYRVLHMARHSETLEELVVYQDVNAPEKIWARPAEMWNETVVVDGEEKKRFEWVVGDE